MVLALFTQLRQQISECSNIDAVNMLFWLDECLGRNKQVTVQTNYFVGIWLLLAIFWRNDENKLNRLYGNLRTALTTYITITWLVFWLVLSGEIGEITNLGGINWNNLMHHYIVPLAFIIDWLWTERTRLKWNYPLLWLIYPILVLIFSSINGSLGLSLGFLYFFLDYQSLGLIGYLMWIFILLSVFILIGLFYVVINLKIILRNH
jgi:hypothetical protein